MTDGHHQVALPAKGPCLQGLSGIPTHRYRRGHHFSLQTVLYLKEIRKMTGHVEAVGRAVNKDQLMEIMTVLRHEVLHCLGKVHEETLLFTSSKAAAPKPDRQAERIHLTVSSCHTNCIANVFGTALRPFLCGGGATTIQEKVCSSPAVSAPHNRNELTAVSHRETTRWSSTTHAKC